MLAACGGDEERAEEILEDAAWAAEDAAAEAEEAAYWARATADDRPVNRACNAPGYEPGDSETSIGLHSPLYSAVEARGELLKQRVLALRPTTTDDELHDVAGYEAAAHAVIALSQWSFVMGQDTMPQSVVRMCDVTSFDEDQCRAIQMLTGSSAEYQNFARDGDGLRYDIVYTDASRAQVAIANADLDGVAFQLESNDAGRFQGDWKRSSDGTETFESTGRDGRFSYLERGDCSGSASAARTDDDGQPWRWSWSWTSARTAEFSMSFEECTFNRETNSEDCVGGEL